MFSNNDDSASKILNEQGWQQPIFTKHLINVLSFVLITQSVKKKLKRFSSEWVVEQKQKPTSYIFE